MRQRPLRLRMGDECIASLPSTPTTSRRRASQTPSVCQVYAGAAMSSNVRLPPELILWILRNVQGDGHTTSVCMRVCTEWYRSLVDSLYELLRLHSRAQLDRLVHAVCTYPDIRDRLVLTRTVVLSQATRSTSVFIDALSLVLRTCIRGIEHFIFQNCLLGQLPQKFFDMLPRLVSVTRLSLTAFYVGSFSQFRRIVCAFPLLRELDLKESRMLTARPYVRRRSADPSSRLVPRLFLLRMNNLEANLFQDLVTWLSSLATCADIKTLDISQGFRGNADAAAVGTLLDQCASSVQHVYLRNTGFGMWLPVGLPHVVTLHFWQGLDPTIASTSLRASVLSLLI